MARHSPGLTRTSVSYLQRQTEKDSERHLIEESLSWQEGGFETDSQCTGWGAQGLPENLPSHPQSSNPPGGSSWCVLMPADDSSRRADGVFVCRSVWLRRGQQSTGRSYSEPSRELIRRNANKNNEWQHTAALFHSYWLNFLTQADLIWRQRWFVTTWWT